MADGQVLNTVDCYISTPLTDRVNTLHFPNEEERDTFWENPPWMKISFSTGLNFIRQGLFIRVSQGQLMGDPDDPVHGFGNFVGINYMRFFDTREDVYYYAFVTSVQYINEGVIQINYVIDPIMTFCQGDNLANLKNTTIQRATMSLDMYQDLEDQLRTNEDVLEATTLYYNYEESYDMGSGGYWVLIQSTASLEEDFGTVNAPLLHTSKGNKFDKIVSPVDNYVIAYDDFTSFMSFMSPFPWISQNFIKCVVLPVDYLPTDQMEVITNAKETFPVDVYKLKDGGASVPVDPSLNLTYAEMVSHTNFSSTVDSALIRQPYVSIEVTSYTGQTIQIDPAFLYTKDLEIHSMTVLGTFNQIVFYPLSYKSKSDSSTELDLGTFLNNAIIWNNFTELPVLVNQGVLSWSSGAYARDLENYRQLTGRLDAITNPKESAKNRVMNAISGLGSIFGGVAKSGNMISAVTSAVTGLGSAYTNEWEYYRTQKAQHKQAMVTAPSLSAQNTSNNFNIANDLNKLWVKILCPSESECKKLETYYNYFGYEMGYVYPDGLPTITNYTLFDYFEMKGNFKLPLPNQYWEGFIPNEYMEILYGTLEMGVRFWHMGDSSSDTWGVYNPFVQDITQNERVSTT